MSTEEAISRIERAIIALHLFWDEDRKAQEETLDTALKCMNALMSMLSEVTK